MNKLIRIYLFLFCVFACEYSIALPSIDIHNKASLQRGAALFINYCSGCHSLNYLSYKQMAQDLEIPVSLLKKNLIFTQSKVTDPIRVALEPEDAKQWFGLMPPDLSLSARQRGRAWLYRYLTGFYQDDTRPFGVNNSLIPNVAMPDVLESLRKKSLLNNPHQSYLNNTQKEKTHTEEFEQELGDLINFLAYVGEPARLQRTQLGPFVILFLMIFLLPVYYLKRLYWSNK